MAKKISELQMGIKYEKKKRGSVGFYGGFAGAVLMLCWI